MIKIIEIYRQVAIKVQIILFLGLMISSCETDLNKNLIEDDVVDSVQQLSVKDQDEFNSLYAEGYEKIQIGEIDSALKILNKAYLIKKTDPHLNYALGYTYSMLGNDSIAILFYTETIMVKSDHSGAYFSRGVSYHLLHLDSLAIIDYTKSITINPNFRDVYYNRAQSYVILNKIQSACTDFQTGSMMGDQNCNALINKYCNF